MAARKSLGQNFLIDRGAVRRIVDALELRNGEPLLEIGPGRGALTAELLRAAGRMAAVELDADLARRLQQSFDNDRLVLFPGSVLRLDMARVLAALGEPSQARLVLVGSPGEADQVVGLAEHEGVTDLVGQTTVGQMMAVIAGADLVIANDSAPAHMAAGFDRPCVALFGPTDPEVWAPKQKAVVTLEAPDGDLSQIASDTVIQEARALLEEG